MIYDKLTQPDLMEEEVKSLKKELSKRSIKISEWEKSTFGEIQTYYEDANLKIIEARLNRKKQLIKGLGRISEAINIYERIKNLLSERLEIVEENQDLSEEEIIIRDKEQELYDKCIRSLNATVRLKEEIELALNQLKELGIYQEDLRKISNLTQEYGVDLYEIIVDTFSQDDQIKGALLDTLKKIEDIFNQYDNWKEIDLTVF
jgi:mevalonate kinase